MERSVQAADLLDRHGVVRRADLLALGVTRSQLDRLIGAGRLRRLRQGWYAVPQADPKVARAVALGGTLSCLSALRYYGVWVPHDHDLHVRMSEHHRHRPCPGGIRLCFAKGRKAPKVPVDSLPDALLAATSCLDAEGIVIVLDSILNQRLLDMSDLVELFAGSPRRVRRLLAKTDAKSESGTESAIRFRLRRKGISVSTQQYLEEVGRVDMRVGARLILEADSVEHHTGTTNYERDRRRDRKTVRQGKFVMRLTYRQVFFEWDDVEPDILDFVRKDRHRARGVGAA